MLCCRAAGDESTGETDLERRRRERREAREARLRYKIWVNLVTVIGLSKERPILDHHAKAHILDFMKSGGFHT